MVVLIPALAQKGNTPFVGRWDLTVTTPEATYPSWMEITGKDGNLEARAQGREGSVHPVTAAKMDGSRLVVTLSGEAPARPATDTRPAAPARPAFTWELSAKGGKLTGFQKWGDTVQGKIAGVPAPTLKRAAPKAWADPEALFNGKDLTGWVTLNNCQKRTATMNHWVVKDGELVNEAEGHNIVSTRKFNDFKLHVEFNLAAGANSGIYLRGRYECQMPPPGTRRPGGGERSSSAGAPGPVPAAGARGGAGGRGPGYAIYGLVPASTAAPCKTGEWCTYDITLVGRHVTLVVNGTMIVDNQEIAGVTGGALDSQEGEPGPIYFQGDHTGGIKYRNITVSVPKR